MQQSGTELLHHVLEWWPYKMCKVEVRFEEMWRARTRVVSSISIIAMRQHMSSPTATDSLVTHTHTHTLPSVTCQQTCDMSTRMHACTNALSHYSGYWVLQQLAPPYKPWLKPSYDTIQDAILTCNQKLTWISFIHCMEPTTKEWKTEKLKSKKRACWEVSVNSPGNQCLAGHHTANWKKTRDTIHLLPITMPNIHQFKIIFHWRNQQ